MMIYKAVHLIQIFGAHGRTNEGFREVLADLKSPQDNANTLSPGRNPRKCMEVVSKSADLLVVPRHRAKQIVVFEASVKVYKHTDVDTLCAASRKMGGKELKGARATKIVSHVYTLRPPYIPTCTHCARVHIS